MISNTLLSQDLGFFKLYSGSGYDTGQGIVQNPLDSSFYITGSSSSWGENQNAYILNIDKEGNYGWSHYYGGSELEIGKRILYRDNYLYLVGMTNSFSGNQDFDIYFAKIQDDGILIFENSFELSGWQYVNDACWKNDSTILITGQTELNTEGENSAFLMELSIEGDSILTKKWGSSGINRGESVEVYGDTCVVYGGSIFDENLNKEVGYIVCEDMNGNVIWLDSLNELSVENCILDFDYGVNKLHVVGFQNTGDYDEYFFNYSLSDGSILNQSIAINNQSSKLIEEVVAFVDGNGGQKIAIGMENYSFSVPERSYDVLIANFNANGLYWLNESRTIEFEQDDEVGEMIQTLDSSYIVVGTNKTQGLANFTNNGGQNVYLFKPGKAINFPLTNESNVLSDLNTLVETPTIQSLVEKNSVFPNPCSDVLNIQVDSPGSIMLFDVKGIMLYKSFATNSFSTLNVSHLASGVYYLFVGNKQYKVLKN